MRDHQDEEYPGSRRAGMSPEGKISGGFEVGNDSKVVGKMTWQSNSN